MITLYDNTDIQAFSADPEDKEKELLKDYYGTAVVNGFPMAVRELSEVDEMDEEEVRERLKELGLDRQE